MRKRDANSSKLMVTACLGVTGFGIGWLIGLSVSPVVSIVVTSITGAAAAIVAALSGLHEQLVGANNEVPDHARPLQWTVDPLPLALLMFGIVVGSLLGIRARNYNWMGSDLSAELQKWTSAGLDQKEVARRLFEIQYPYTPYVRSKNLLGPDLFTEFSTWISATNTLTDPANLPLYNEIAKHLLELDYPPITESNNLVNSALTANNTTRTYGSILSAGDNGSNRVESQCNDLKGKQGTDLVNELNHTEWANLTTLITDTEKLKEIVGKVLCDTGS